MLVISSEVDQIRTILRGFAADLRSRRSLQQSLVTLMGSSSRQLLPEKDRDHPRPSRAARHHRHWNRPAARPKLRRRLIKVTIALLVVAMVGVVLLSAEGLLPGESSSRQDAALTPWSGQLSRALSGGSAADWAKQDKKKSADSQVDAKASGPLKPVLGGLLDRQKLPDKSYWSVLSGFVVQVDWSQLQSAPGAPLPANNPIDQAIAAARAAGLRIKLRVDAGTMAPEWAKSLGGSPVPVQFTNPVTGAPTSGTIGRFWTPAFGRAYQDLQNKLAARYDNVPEIAQTSITRCITFFAEPFLRQARRIPATADEKFTEAMMHYCRSLLGARCVLENHSIRTTSQSVWYGPMYAAIKALV